jgi:ribosome-binding protein aMBF1 (putative translation factor)
VVSDSDQLVIKRAVNEVQARTRKWWLRHPGCVKNVAIVDTADYAVSDPSVEICCGKVRELTTKTSCTGVLICEGKAVKKRTWRLLEENPIQIDTDDGTDWIIEYADWELPDTYTPLIQSALIAATGMSDADLASMLKVKPLEVKKWYSGIAPIPNKVIKEIVTRFIS